MKKHVSRRLTPQLSVAILLLMILAFLQGCDSLTSQNIEENNQMQTNSSLQPTQSSYKNPPDSNWTSTSDNSTLQLQLSSNSINKSRDLPALSRRIELEYGVLRRLLKRYGVDIQVLESHNMDRDHLHNHANMNRLLKRYGITPRVLSSNGDQLTDALLVTYSVTEDILSSEGITQENVDQFNAFNALLNLYQTSVEQYVRDQKSTQRELNILGYLDIAPPSLEVTLNSDILDDVIIEMGDDPDIQRVQVIN